MKIQRAMYIMGLFLALLLLSSCILSGSKYTVTGNIGNDGAKFSYTRISAEGKLSSDLEKTILDNLTLKRSIIPTAANEGKPVIKKVVEVVEKLKPVLEPDETTENLKYYRRTNGDRPTWYGAKHLAEYPPIMQVIIPGCVDRVIEIVNSRYDIGDGLVVKESGEGRGLGVIYKATCQSKEAFIVY